LRIVRLIAYFLFFAIRNSSRSRCLALRTALRYWIRLRIPRADRTHSCILQ